MTENTPPADDVEFLGALDATGTQLGDELLELETFIKRSMLFESLEAEGRRQLAQAARYRWITKGESVVEEGTNGDAFFLIKSGEIGVKTTKEGAPVALAKLNAGEFFGEVGMLTGRPRTATCVALIDSEVFEFHREHLQPIFDKHPETVRKIRHAISTRSEDTIRKLFS